MNGLPSFVLIAILWATSAVGADQPETRDIVYRGSLLTFQIPADWAEEYEPDGSGVFYENVPGSGTLRLSVTTAPAEDPGGNSVAAALAAIPGVEAKSIERLANGNALATATRRTSARDPMTLYWWYVASPVPPGSMRIATFSYTILTANESDARTRRDLQFAERTARAARFNADRK